jgi:DNA-binding GntR family transcriptional regulator
MVDVMRNDSADRLVRARNLVSQLHEELRLRIQSGQFKASDRLNINALAKEFGISPTPVREALAMLSAEKLVEFKENSGYSVAPAPTREEFIQWAMARVIIETQSMMLHEGEVARQTISALKRANRRIEQGELGSGVAEISMFSDANWEFHRILVGLADNVFLANAHQTLYRGRRFSQIFLGRGIVDRRQIVDEHNAIIAALEIGNLELAATELKQHIELSLYRDRKFASDSENTDVE